MKKLLFLLFFLPFFADAQIHNQVRARQLIADSNVNLRRIRIDSMRLDTGTVVPWLGDFNSGATVDPIYRFVKGRQDWTINYANTLNLGGCQNKTLTPYSIVWAGANFDFVVSAGDYSIECITYSNAVTPVSLVASDPAGDRTDVIYLDATGVHVLTGVVAPPGTSLKPLVQGDQIELTSILVAAAATAPTVTEQIVYDENTESIVSHIGTSANGAYATNPYHLTLSALFGTLTLNDYLIFTKVSGSWDLSAGYTAMTFFIKLTGPIPPGGNLRVALYNGVQQVSNEVVLAINKTDITNYQGVSISAATFGNLVNSFITSVRYRYTTSSTDPVAPQIDYIKFTDGNIIVPGAGTSRFGVFAEDAAASQNRNFNLGVFNMTIGSGLIPNITASINASAIYGGAAGFGSKLTLTKSLAELLLDSNGVNGRFKVTKIGSNSLATMQASGYEIIDVPDSSEAGTHYELIWNGTNDRIYKRALSAGGGGGSQTLQQVFNQEVGGSVLTKTDTIEFAGNGLLFHDNSIGGGYDRAIISQASTYFATTNAAGTRLSTILNTPLASRLDQEYDGQYAGFALDLVSFTYTTANIEADSISLNVFGGGVKSGGSIAVRNNVPGPDYLSNASYIYADDVASSSEMFVRDEAGNATQISPHNFTGIPQGRSEPMSVSIYSERDGQYVNIDLVELARQVEKLTGKKLVYTGEVKNKPNPHNK